jgi:hypothetical protein
MLKTGGASEEAHPRSRVMEMLKKMLNKIVLLLALCGLAGSLAAQTETFDITKYTPPQGWKKDVKADSVSFTITDASQSRYCIIAVYTARSSVGDAAADFAAEWAELVVKPFGAGENPPTQSMLTTSGHKAIAGAAAFKNQGTDNAVMLAAFTVSGKTASVVVLMNSMDHQAEVKKFLEGISFVASPAAPTAVPAAAGSSFRDVSFTAPRGWAQTNYTDGIGLQSPEMECGTSSNYKIIIFNNRPFTGDLKKQAQDVWFELFNPARNGEVEMKKWASPEGWEFVTYEHDANLSLSDNMFFHGRVLLVRLGSQVAIISLQSNRTVNSTSSNELKCKALETAWKKFLASLQFKGPRGDVNGTAVPEELLGRWESKMTTGVSYYGAISSQILAAYTFRENGYCKSKSLFRSDADGRFAIKGNRITITSPGGLSETFTFRIESELAYTYWHKYLILTDKNGNESRLLFIGD